MNVEIEDRAGTDRDLEAIGEPPGGTRDLGLHLTEAENTEVAADHLSPEDTEIEMIAGIRT